MIVGSKEQQHGPGFRSHSSNVRDSRPLCVAGDGIRRGAGGAFHNENEYFAQTNSTTAASLGV